MTRAKTYRRAEHLSSAELGDGVLIYNPAAKSVHILNQTGRILWDQLAEQRSERELSGILARQFAGVEAPLLEADLTQFLTEMSDLKILNAT